VNTQLLAKLTTSPGSWSAQAIEPTPGEPKGSFSHLIRDTSDNNRIIAACLNAEEAHAIAGVPEMLDALINFLLFLESPSSKDGKKLESTKEVFKVIIERHLQAPWEEIRHHFVQ
jgi:hypothetical protein